MKAPTCLMPYFGGMTGSVCHYLKHMPFPIRDYREPFIGGGSVFTRIVITQGFVPPRVWINDIDPSTYAVYAAAGWYPELFKEGVRDFSTKNIVKNYGRIRSKFLAGIPTPKSKLDIVETAVDKMFIQLNSYQSLGQQAGPRRKSSSPMNAQSICDKIDWYWPLLRGAEITCGDFAPLFKGKDGFVFCDSPFYQNGPDKHSDRRKREDAKRAYQYSFKKESEHERLGDCCRKTGHRVLLSYDSSSFIRDLHKDAIVNPIETYYHASQRRATKLAIVWPANPMLDAATITSLRILQTAALALTSSDGALLTTS